jgi:hypothetical protein
MRTRHVFLTAVAVLAVSAGCAASSDGPSAGSPGSTGTTPSPTTSAGTLPVPTSPPVKPSVPAGEITVTGTVVSGVEPNCWVLQGEGQSYLLIPGSGARPNWSEGAKVKVKGRVKPDQMTTCMQGIPLEVISVTPA